jgi:hypothetical protein
LFESVYVTALDNDGKVLDFLLIDPNVSRGSGAAIPTLRATKAQPSGVPRFFTH